MSLPDRVPDTTSLPPFLLRPRVHPVGALLSVLVPLTDTRQRTAAPHPRRSCRQFQGRPCLQAAPTPKLQLSAQRTASARRGSLEAASCTKRAARSPSGT